MNLKSLRIFAYVVISACIFVTGVSSGIIIESVGIIRQNADDIKSFTGTAEFLTSTQRQSTQNSEDYESYLNELFTPFWESWDLLHAYYVDQPLDDDAMLEGAIRGMISALGDPHTRYANPDEYQDEVESSAGEYQGIGAYVDVTGDHVKISSTMPGSPAEEAGLRTGDLVT